MSCIVMWQNIMQMHYYCHLYCNGHYAGWQVSPLVLEENSLGYSAWVFTEHMPFMSSTNSVEAMRVIPIFRNHPLASFLGRRLRVNLIKWVSNVRPSAKRFFDFNEIWYAGRGRRVMHDGMQYDPIQGQGHEPFKVGNSAIFKGYLLPHLQLVLANDRADS